MKIPLIALISAILVAASCSTPDRELSKVQRALVQALSDRPFFLVAEGRDTLHLPLPPSSAWRTEIAARTVAWRASLAVIDTQALRPARRAEWRRLASVLEALPARERVFTMQDTYCGMDSLLSHFFSPEKGVRHPGLLVRLVEVLPDYLGAVREGLPDAIRSSPGYTDCVGSGIRSVGILNEVLAARGQLSIGYRERLEQAVPQSILAIKDHLAYLGSQGR
jgi:hypothetical protein